jgi:hypothetical protein
LVDAGKSLEKVTDRLPRLCVQEYVVVLPPFPALGDRPPFSRVPSDALLLEVEEEDEEEFDDDDDDSEGAAVIGLEGFETGAEEEDVVVVAAFVAVGEGATAASAEAFVDAEEVEAADVVADEVEAAVFFSAAAAFFFAAISAMRWPISYCFLRAPTNFSSS